MLEDLDPRANARLAVELDPASGADPEALTGEACIACRRQLTVFEVALARATGGPLRCESCRPEPRGAIPLRKGDAAPRNRRLVVLPASKVRRRRVEWLWPGRVPLGALTVLQGQEGLGKSLLALHLAARLSRGELPGGPAVAVVVSCEDDLEAVVRSRLEAAGANLELIDLVAGVELEEGLEAPVSFPIDLEALGERVRERNARLIVVDPLVAALDPRVNSWKDQDVRLVLAPLHRLAERAGAAVLATLHLNKAAGSDPLRRASGSVGFTAAARSVLLLARDPDDPEGERGRQRILAPVKDNLAELAPSLRLEIEPVFLPARDEEPAIDTARIVERGECSTTARELLAAAHHGPDDRERSAIQEAEDFLREALADGARPAAEVKREARAAGISERTLDRARSRLGVRARKSGFGDAGWVWEATPILAKAAGENVGARSLARMRDPASDAGLGPLEGSILAKPALYGENGENGKSGAPLDGLEDVFAPYLLDGAGRCLRHPGKPRAWCLECRHVAAAEERG